MGCFVVPSLVRDFSLPGISSLVLFVSPHLVPSGFVPTLLVPAFSFGLFFVSLDRVGTLLYYGGHWGADAAAMASSGGLESRLSLSGGSGAVAAWIRGRLVAL